MKKPDIHPETRTALFQKSEIRRRMHDGERWFVITDIIAALTDAVNPSDYWKKMRKRDPDLGEALQGGGQFVPPPLLWSLQLPAGVRNSNAGTSGIRPESLSSLRKISNN